MSPSAVKPVLVHPFPAFVGEAPRALVLGSFPSVKSRETGFYYGHPQNRFWRVLAAVTGEETPVSQDEKKRLLSKHGVALWDSIASCTVEGSSDSSIRNAVPNDIASLLRKTGISRVYCNGRKAYELYQKYVFPTTGLPAALLPSTSPANASWSLEMLTEAWRVIVS